jgi:hypothetical protein
MIMLGYTNLPKDNAITLLQNISVRSSKWTEVLGDEKKTGRD